MNRQSFSVKSCKAEAFTTHYSVEYYSLFLFRGEHSFMVDETIYNSHGYTLLFLSPFQPFRWMSDESTDMQLVQFHGDFYCIEYHKKEVACNGLLFNNIYLSPSIEVDQTVWDELELNLRKMSENSLPDAYSEAVVKSYLQLILAISSKIKAKMLTNVEEDESPYGEMTRFQKLIENHFIKERGVSFYADSFSLTSNAFSKKIKKEFGKTPMQLIQERVTLEAKKLLHLTYKSVKEIAAELNFEDEFYFSRYFKKNVGVSPLRYREKVGISIVAKISM